MINLKRGISTPIAITIIIVLVILIGGGILGYQYYWLPKEEAEAPKTETQTPTQTQPLTETPKDETVDWETYQNEFYRYEIRYPLNWTIQISPDLTHQSVELWSSSKLLGIHITVSQITQETLKDYLKDIDTKNSIESSGTVLNSKNITISGYPAIQREEMHFPAGFFYELLTYLKKDNLLIMLGTIKDKTNYRPSDSLEITDTERKIYNQILSTFRFID